MKKLLSLILCLLGMFLLVGCDAIEQIKYGDEEQYKVYQLAKESGYTGTYEEWLNTIKGEKGDQGEPGLDGVDGVSIVSITKESSNGLVDTYVILFSNGTTTSFTVTNGEQGIQGEKGDQGIQGEKGDQGIQGEKGDQGEQGIQGEKGDQGEQGIQGEKGKSAFEIFKEYYPDYTGTEKEWIRDVAMGNKCNLFGHSWDDGVITTEPTKGNEGEKTYSCENCDEHKYEVLPKIEEDMFIPSPTSVTISGENEVFVGYSIKLLATVTPMNAVQTVVWTSSDESLATVDQNGTVLALKVGTVCIKAACTENSSITFTFTIKIKEMKPVEPYPNMGGYEIVIMNADSALVDTDPFLDGYIGADKAYKQKAWREVETNFNCKISVVAYPTTAPWGAQRIAWIKDNASANTSQCDLAVVSSNWVPQFAKENAAVNVKEYYDEYGLEQMEQALYEVGTYKNKLYTASTGKSETNIYVDLGLYYNLTWMQSLGVKDPAQMFLDGEWTYSGFEKWVLETQAKLNEGEFVFGGHPYYYYYGMTNAAGVKIADATLVQTNISSPKSKAACELIYKLVEAGCNDEVISWAESDGGFIDGTTLMTTGYLWFVRIDNRWKSNMFGDDTRYGYVPFPYPDDVAKEDTRIGVSGLSVLMYVAGRNYPAGVTTKEVYRAVNEMFLNTIQYQKADPDFDANAVKRNTLRSRIDNPASIEAIMYYDASKVFYDPAHAIYSSASASVLKTPANNVMYKGYDFDNAFNEVKESFDYIFKNMYS